MTRGSPEASPISFGGPLPCGICAREVPREPVVLATCGHVYCWPCLYRYIVRLDAHPCPACDVPFTRESISPIYTRGGSGEDECEEAEADARGGIPPRPTARGSVSSRRRVSPGRSDTSDAGGGRAGECAKIALGVGAVLVGIAAMVFVT